MTGSIKLDLEQEQTSGVGYELLSRVVFWFYVVLLIPWPLVALVSLMAFDGGPSWNAYLFVTSIWTYPVSMFIAFKLRDRSPVWLFVPCVNIALLCVQWLFYEVWR